MNVKNTFIIILLLLILFSAVSAVSADDDRSYKIDQAYIDLDVAGNGLLHVDERYDYSFDGKFNGVYRDIPLKDGESIKNIRVSAVGAYPVLKISDDEKYKHLKIYLYSDAAHTRGIRDCDVSVYIHYDMENVVTVFNDIASLHYKLWGEEWDIGVGSLTATVTLPGANGNTYYLNPEDYNESSSLNGNTIIAQSGKIPKGEFYELVALMPVDDFDNATYAKHVNSNGKEQIMKNLEDSVSSRNFWNTTYFFLGLLSIFSPLGAAFTYLRYGREPDVSYDGIYERDLPSNDSPEVINALIENKKNIGTPNIRGFEASIMNLIDRKVIRLHNEANNDLNELILTFDNTKTDEITDSEEIVLATLKHFSTDNVLNLSEMNSRMSSESNAEWFMDQINYWQRNVNSKIEVSDYFNNTGSDIIKYISVGGIIFGIILTILGSVGTLGNALYTLIAGIFLIIFSVALLFLDDDIFGQWTENGRVFYLKWSNFKKFLKDNSLINEHPPESIVVWKKYLIYGAALGVADKVYDSMKLQMPNIREYDDDDLFMYHHYGGYGMMYSAYNTSSKTLNSSSDSSDFGSLGGGSGGGGGGAF